MKQSTLTSRYTPIISRPILRWIVILGSWTVFGLFMAWESYFQFARSGKPISWDSALFGEMIYAYLWAILTPLIFRLASRFPLERGRWVTSGSLHLVLSILIAVFHKATLHVLTISLTATPENPFTWDRFVRAMFSYLDYGVMLYWVLVVYRHAYEYFRRFTDT